MALAPGARLGPYEVIAAIGKGGMGEVYRARDAALQRDVAVKVLPDLFAADPERLARFEREARVLAALNHPNVAHIYGVESGALVMEFVDGEDLAAHIAAAGRLAIDDAVPIAIQIAEALEAAHDLGIVHRDLKPANIKVRPDGTVKVLDFGLAKAFGPPDPAPGGAHAFENSPTITTPFQMSRLGVILGTAAYMAPEQAKGKAVDKRADIWAFGCVLYEMLTGRRPFAGEDVTDTLAAIVRADPDWTALPADLPAPIRTLLRRCLQKDRRERLPDIGAARLELKEARVPEPAGATPAVPARRGRAAWLPWVLFAAASTVAIGALLSVALSRAPAETRVYKSFITPPAPLGNAPALRLSISPDGTRLALVGTDQSGRRLLWLRPLNALTAQPLAGTTNAVAPFWSPDARWVGFIADGKLKKIELNSGAVTTLCEAVAAPTPSWNRDGTIVFSGPSGGIYRVRDSGGTSTPVTQPAGEASSRHIAPFFLPDGRHFVFASSAAGSSTPGIYIGSIDSKEFTRLLPGSSNPSYANGYLLYMRDTTLVAHPFDPGKRSLSGEPLPVAEGIQVNPATGTGAYAVSQNGVLVYQTGESAGTQVAWLDRTGKIAGTLGEAAGYRDVELSPDARFASFTIASASRSDVWLYDVGRNLPRRFTFGDDAFAGVWSPDGERIAFSRVRGSAYDLYIKPTSGVGAEQLLLKDGRNNVPMAFTPDGRALIYGHVPGTLVGELWMLPLDGSRTPRPLLGGSATRASSASVSPDGRWLAFAAEQNGNQNVFVTSFPDASGRWQVSTEGGGRPRWRRDGKQLFFMASDELMAADVDTTGPQFDLGTVRRLFEVHVPSPTLGTRSPYAVTPDGQRFLVNTWDARGSQAPLTLVVNWPASIAR